MRTGENRDNFYFDTFKFDINTWILLLLSKLTNICFIRRNVPKIKQVLTAGTSYLWAVLNNSIRLQWHFRYLWNSRFIFMWIYKISGVRWMKKQNLLFRTWILMMTQTVECQTLSPPGLKVGVQIPVWGELFSFLLNDFRYAVRQQRTFIQLLIFYLFEGFQVKRFFQDNFIT